MAVSMVGIQCVPTAGVWGAALLLLPTITITTTSSSRRLNAVSVIEWGISFGENPRFRI